jgi:protocatechuate 3,4-dioxygenase beta subunit
MRSFAVFSRLLALGALSFLASALPSSSAGAQAATVTGRVTATETRQPLAEVRVSVVGATLATLTDSQGRYSLRSVPPGRIELRVQRVGYSERTRPVTVAPARR